MTNNSAIRGWTEVETWAPDSPGNEELRALAADLLACAQAEQETDFLLAVRRFVNHGVGDVPDPEAYGLSEETAQAIVLSVLAVEVPAAERPGDRAAA